MIVMFGPAEHTHHCALCKELVIQGDDHTCMGLTKKKLDQALHEKLETLQAHMTALEAAMPMVPHPGGRLVKVVAHYEDGSKQTIDGEVVTAAIAKAKGE